MTSDQIDEATQRLVVTARLAGPNHLVLLDVAAPDGTPAELGPAMRAAEALHHSIEADDALSDIEEALEDAIKADDAIAIDEGCDLYRALLAFRLKAILALPDGREHLENLVRSTR